MVLVAVVSALFVAPSRQTASADHGTCSDDPRSGATQIANCISSKRDKYNVACYETNTGNNNAIAECVRQVDAHFTDTTGNPPPLPTAITPNSTAPPLDCAALPDDFQDWTTEQKQNCIAQPHGTACTGQESTACGLFTYINTAIKLLSALIGIVVTGMIIVGGIKYSMAGSDPGAVEKAKKLIFSAILTLVGYGLLFAVAQWLLPGGIL